MMGIVPPDMDYAVLYGGDQWRTSPLLVYAAEHHVELNALARQILRDYDVHAPLREYLRRNGPVGVFAPEVWPTWWAWASRALLGEERRLRRPTRYAH